MKTFTVFMVWGVLAARVAGFFLVVFGLLGAGAGVAVGGIDASIKPFLEMMFMGAALLGLSMYVARRMKRLGEQAAERGDGS